MIFTPDINVPPLFPAPPINEKSSKSVAPPKSALPLTPPLTEKHKSPWTPKPYRIMQNIRSINACTHRNAAIDNNDVLWVWGAISQGRYFDDVPTDDGEKIYVRNEYVYSDDVSQNVNYIPSKVMENVSSVSTGAWHYMCITKDGKLWGWGKNDDGQLGLGDRTDRDEPVFIMDDVKSVYASYQNTFAIKNDGSLWGWGYNNNDYSPHDKANLLLDAPKYCTSPVFLLDDIESITAGYFFAMAVKKNGELLGWGINMADVLFAASPQKDCTPMPLMTEIKSAAMSIHDHYCLVTAKDGGLYVLGFGDKTGGMLIWYMRNKMGNGPIKVMDNVEKAFAGHWFSLILLRDGRLFSSGANELGQGGTGKFKSAGNKPGFVMNHVVEATAGHFHGMALQSNGDLWIWGGDYGVSSQY